MELIYSLLTVLTSQQNAVQIKHHSRKLIPKYKTAEPLQEFSSTRAISPTAVQKHQSEARLNNI
jgi:hypothetical protein